MKFNEDSRVKIPAILHLTRLGYTYLSLKGLEWDESSNIVPSIFRESVFALNPKASKAEIENALGHLNAYSGQADQRFGPWRSRVRACRSRSERSDAELF